MTGGWLICVYNNVIYCISFEILVLVHLHIASQKSNCLRKMIMVIKENASAYKCFSAEKIDRFWGRSSGIDWELV